MGRVATLIYRRQREAKRSQLLYASSDLRSCIEMDGEKRVDFPWWFVVPLVNFGKIGLRI